MTWRIRGKPAANVRTETGRASVSSMAFHKVQPLPVATCSTSRYRPASRVPGSEVYVLIRQRQEQGWLSASFQPLISHDHRPMVMNLLLSDVLPFGFFGERARKNKVHLLFRAQPSPRPPDSQYPPVLPE